MKKFVDAKTKTSLQPYLRIKKIDVKYPKGYRPAKKKDKLR